MLTASTHLVLWLLSGRKLTFTECVLKHLPCIFSLSPCNTPQRQVLATQRHWDSEIKLLAQNYPEGHRADKSKAPCLHGVERVVFRGAFSEDGTLGAVQRSGRSLWEVVSEWSGWCACFLSPALSPSAGLALPPLAPWSLAPHTDLSRHLSSAHSCLLNDLIEVAEVGLFGQTGLWIKRRQRWDLITIFGIHNLSFFFRTCLIDDLSVMSYRSRPSQRGRKRRPARQSSLE